MRKDEIINSIHYLGCEYEIMNYLVSWSKNELTKAECENNELAASLRAIKSINNGKNEAIEALCSEED